MKKTTLDLLIADALNEGTAASSLIGEFARDLLDEEPGNFKMLAADLDAVIDIATALRDQALREGVGDEAIFDAVIDAMQPAEELGGPEGAAYVRLMEKIAQEAARRAAVMQSRLDEEDGDLGDRCTILCRRDDGHVGPCSEQVVEPDCDVCPADSGCPGHAGKHTATKITPTSAGH